MAEISATRPASQQGRVMQEGQDMLVIWRATSGGVIEEGGAGVEMAVLFFIDSLSTFK